jgi:hypothetical protein
VRDLGIYIDADLSGPTHVLRTTAPHCIESPKLKPDVGSDRPLLFIPRSRLVTVGDRSFSVTEAQSGPPETLRTSPWLSSFERQLNP